MPEARNNEYKMTVYKFTMNTPIEIEVPVGYKLVQDGMNIKFVKIDERFLSWEEKDSGLNGYYIDVASGVYTAGN
jgi:hypothetical protein